MTHATPMKKYIPLLILLSGCMNPRLPSPTPTPAPVPPGTLLRTTIITSHARRSPAPPLPPGASRSSQVVAAPYVPEWTGSLVCNATNPGMLTSFDGSLAAMTLVPVGTPWNGSNQVVIPTPLKPRVKKTATVTQAGPVLSDFFHNFGTNRVLFVDAQNLVAGHVYSMQTSADFKTWKTTATIAWTSTDPTAYWRNGASVPKTGNFHIVTRLFQTP